MRYGFEVAGLERIISATMATNAASRRVMEKCGLRFQGELPMAATVVAWYAIDRAHWHAGQTAASSETQGRPVGGDLRATVSGNQG